MQQQPRVPLWFLAANLALVTAAFLVGAMLGSRRIAEFPTPQRRALELVYREVLESHIEPPDESELLERAITGMVDGLDEYSRYIPPKLVPRYDEDNSGHYEGIGARILPHGNDVVVHFTNPDGPADTAGLLPGDIVRTVDGTPFDSATTIAKIIELVRGPANTVVKLGIERNGVRRDIDVRRGDVQTSCVKWVHYADVERGLGYLHLTDFHPTSHAQLLAAIDLLKAEGQLRGLIIDLRFDGGGSLDQCLAIARTFLPKGVIATQYRRNGEDEIYEADPEQCDYPDLPLVILVNESSASASEVLSGALQDNDRAVIVGRRTHGKGYVNTVYSWENLDFKLKLTTGSYRTPSGRNIERNHTTNQTPADKENGGIFPDVEVEVDQATRAAIFTVLDRTLEVPRKHRDAFAAVAKKYGIEVPSPPQAASDPQFEAALKALREQLGN